MLVAGGAAARAIDQWRRLAVHPQQGAGRRISPHRLLALAAQHTHQALGQHAE
ncbi:hypothetical protein D3C77_783080 [compost metagenome]